ncbi:MAG: glutamine-hydrolyzing carbamoyl-phosphate synthase small subunit [Coriobacteriales bacterium]|jgi:carbamoyl-phosphate synthase small subunit|nr:glutamine-hydrolyzing carbamoyl-phosphate synthase small subunit [Coriobacteriales bacterium]
MTIQDRDTAMKARAQSPALLVLEDGTVYEGKACGAVGEAYGEICFNTSLVGYLEVLSDASYAGEIITMTYPQIGNYGVARADMQRDKIAAAGLVVHEMCYEPSNFRSDISLPDFLCEQGVVAIDGIDTRALVQHIREVGTMRAVISTGDLDSMSLLEKVKASPELTGRNLVRDISISEPYEYDGAVDDAAYGFALSPAPKATHHVVAYDCGAKRGILRNLYRAGCRVTVVPWDTPAADVLALHPDGVFISNGPGDPQPVDATYSAVRELIGKVPLFGICLGCQMLGLAAGATTERLRFGHHGGNHPVQNLLTGKVEITAQNHNFGVVFDSMGKPVEGETGLVENADFGRIRLTHKNLNDGTLEGFQFLDVPAFCVQYHPEASPGPTDSHYLFTAFTRLMDGRDDYLDIDISADRLSEWR